MITNKVQTLLSYLEEGLFERTLALRLCLITALSGESIFLYGPPGTGKSLLARRLHNAFADARVFDYLMGRFSTPEELFGPLSIASLRDHDKYERRFEGYLPSADIVFLDEVWKAAPPIQNALLTALNEKIWRNGDHEVQLPLKCLIGASNETGAHGDSGAFWDRFLVRIEIPTLSTYEGFCQLLKQTMDPYHDPVPREIKITQTEWDDWQKAMDIIELQDQDLGILFAVRSKISKLTTLPCPSDRRWKKAVKILKSLAIASGRNSLQAGDYLALPYCLWDQPEHIGIIADLVMETLSQVLFLEYPLNQELRKGVDEFEDTQGQSPREKPKLVDSEYYILEPGGLRIWYGDWDEAREHIFKDVDVFEYEDDTYRDTRTISLAKGSKPWTLVSKDASFSLVMEGSMANQAPGKSQGGIDELSTLWHGSLQEREKQGGLFAKHLLGTCLGEGNLFKEWDKLLSRAGKIVHGSR